MSQDSFTEISTEGWFSRIGSSLKGILFGLGLFVISFFLLFWNEGRTVERMQTLNEGSGAVVSVDAITLVPQYDGKLVHFSSFLTTDETLTDPKLPVSAEALKLSRQVEIYQWVEKTSTHTETSMGGEKKTTTEYTYTKEWQERLQSSQSFKIQEGHTNPSQIEFSSQETTTDKATAGAFRIPTFLVDKLTAYESLTLDTTKPLPNIEGYTAHYFDKGYYFGNTISAPSIGDIKVAFKVVKPQDVSIVAQQSAHTVTAYQTEVGGTIAMLTPGIKSAKSMFKQAHEDNIMMQWILRAVGFGMMVAGIFLIFSPLGIIADVVPFIGSMVNGGVLIFALLISLVLSFVTIGFAWLFYRPLIGIALLAVAGGTLWLIKVKFKKPVVST